MRVLCAAIVVGLSAFGALGQGSAPEGAVVPGAAVAKEPGVFESMGAWFSRRVDTAKAPFKAAPTNGAPLGMSLLTALPESEMDSCPRLVWDELLYQEVPVDAVVLIHGLDEPGNIWDDVGPHLHKAGYAVVRFDYPNDQAIADSAVMLVESLRELQMRGTRRVTLIGHSMGGLVIREALTSPHGYGFVFEGRYDLPEITRVITVASPIGGSEFARFRSVLEIRERLGRVMDHDDADWFDLFRNTDGNGEAGRDLTPGSDFLNTLALRPCPVDLKQTAIVSRWVTPMGSALEQFINGRRMRGMLGDERALRWLNRLEATSDRLGDGVVTVESACAAEVADTVMLNADHRNLLSHRSLLDSVPLFACDANRPEVPVAIPVILDRLERDRAER